MPSAIAIIIWRFIYDPDAGFLNELLTVMGGTPQNWLNDPSLVKPSLVLMMTWGAFGTTALIYLATLNEIPTELYERRNWTGQAAAAHPFYHRAVSRAGHVGDADFAGDFGDAVVTEPFLMTRGGRVARP